nr:MFS transporter [uncultured bacterium]
MRGVLADRDLRILLAADALSLVGSGALWLALGIWAKEMTGSNAAAGMVIFAVLAPPVLLGPLAGMLVDRVRRRPLLVTVNLVTAAVVLLLLLVRDSGQLWLLYVVAAVYGASWALLRSAQSALLRTLVTDPDRLAAANGALQTIAALSRLASPVAGAGLYATLGAHSVALLDAATFLLAAGGLALLRVAEPRPVPGDGSWWAEVSAGAVHLRETVVLRQIVVAVSAAMLVIGFIEVLLYAVVDAGLGRSPAFVGVLDLGFGAGSVVGGLLAAPVLRRLGPGHSVTAGLVAVALGEAALIVPSAPVAIAGLAVVGLGVPPIVAGMSTTLQRLTPAHLQGRTFSAVDVLISTPQSLSIAAGAVLAATVDHRVLLAVTTGVILLSALYLGTRPEQRRFAAGPDTGPTPDSGPGEVPVDTATR